VNHAKGKGGKKMANAIHIKKPTFIRASQVTFEYREKCNPSTCNLELLTYGTYHISAHGASSELLHPKEEALLFCLSGAAQIDTSGHSIKLNHYDVLYIPLNTTYRIINESAEDTMLIICRAPASQKHNVYHASWQKISKDESRIRHLKDKDVFLMFDVSESADKLIAGYTIYEPHTRAWPPHNHTDQEEIYIFTKGSGAIEVYSDEENKTFVHNVKEMDAVTIPVLNYHPVFSHNENLHFLWCIAGERYWIGDKHKDFLKGKEGPLTT
jgi:mannose-6-phosphate isomerase-like protein (cupin superfamily)